MRNQRIVAVNSNCYHGYTVEEAIAGIREAGFHYIELTATKGWTEHIFADMSFRRLTEIQELLEKNGLIPFAASGHTNLMDSSRLHDFADNIRMAHFFGSTYIVTSIGEAHLRDAAKAGNELVAENIRGFIPLLEKYDMQLVLEVHGEHGSGARIREITDLVHHPRVGINYDTANAIFYGGVDVVEDIQGCIGDIHYMHIKEKAGEKKAWDFPTLGRGYVPFPRIFDMMDAANNSSPYSVEIEFTQAGPKDLDEVNRAVRDSAEYLKAQGFTL